MHWCVDPSVDGSRRALADDISAYLVRRLGDPDAVAPAVRKVVALLDDRMPATPCQVTLLWGDTGTAALDLGPMEAIAPGAPLPGVAIGPGATACPWAPGEHAPPRGSALPVVLTLGVMRPAEEAIDVDVGSFDLPSGRDEMLTALAAMSTRLDGSLAEHRCAFAGAAAARRAETEFRAQHPLGPMDARQVAEAFVAYQETIGGDFQIEEASAHHAVVSNHTCPFGAAVGGAPQLCRFTSAMLGSMAARQAAEASVRLDERLAVGDRHCRLSLRLGPAQVAGAHHYRWPPGGSVEPATVSISLRLPHDRASVTVARHLARHALVAIDVAGDVVDDIELALSEACTNVLNHSGVSDSYEVGISVRADRCEVRVADRGCGFDYEVLRQHQADDDAERGRGLAIMRAVMDRAAVVSRPEHGTTVTLVKRLTFTEGSAAAALLRPPGQRPPPALAV